MHLKVKLLMLQEIRGYATMTKLESLLHVGTGLSLVSGYLMYSRRHLLSFNKKHKSETTQSISVIIPARNEEMRLPKLLKVCLGNQYELNVSSWTMIQMMEQLK